MLKKPGLIRLIKIGMPDSMNSYLCRTVLKASGQEGALTKACDLQIAFAKRKYRNF